MTYDDRPVPTPPYRAPEPDPALVDHLAAAVLAQLDTLAGEPVAARFYAVMRAYFAAAAPRRDAVGVLFGAPLLDPAIRPGVERGDAGPDRLRAALKRLVAEAPDAPPAVQAEAFATLLYSLHAGLVLFWLYDRSPHQRATGELLVFVRDMLGLLRTMLPLPMVRGAVLRLAGIMAGLFGP